jgi:hypothetical protein
VIPGLAKPAAVPVANGVPEQSAVAKSFTDDEASADPITFGVVDAAGDTGAVLDSVGAEGAVESLTYDRAELHTDVFPAASVAVARTLVVEFELTVIAIPGLASSAAVAVASGDPEQSALL